MQKLLTVVCIIRTLSTSPEGRVGYRSTLSNSMTTGSSECWHRYRLTLSKPLDRRVYFVFLWVQLLVLLPSIGWKESYLKCVGWSGLFYSDYSLTHSLTRMRRRVHKSHVHLCDEMYRLACETLKAAISYILNKSMVFIWEFNCV